MKKLSPKPWRIAHRDDTSCMSMSIIVDADFKGDLNNVCCYADMAMEEREHVVAIFFHQLTPRVGAWAGYPDNYGNLERAKANGQHIVDCVNQSPAADAEAHNKLDAAKDAVVEAARSLTGEYIVAHGLMGKLADALAALDEVRDV